MGQQSGSRGACREAVITRASVGEKASLAPRSHLSVIFLSAFSTYAPVKSFLRVDKEKVSFLLPLLHPHPRGNSADLTCAVPGLVVQIPPKTLLEPSESSSAGMPDPTQRLQEPENPDEQVHWQAWRNWQKLFRAWPEPPGPRSPHVLITSSPPRSRSTTQPSSSTSTTGGQSIMGGTLPLGCWYSSLLCMCVMRWVVDKIAGPIDKRESALVGA